MTSPEQQNEAQNVSTSAANSNSAEKIPFNMTLKESERKAKEALSLPYTELKHISFQDQGGLVKIHGMKKLEQPGSGLVHYVPDEADDLDDSDPDDDLNI